MNVGAKSQRKVTHCQRNIKGISHCRCQERCRSCIVTCSTGKWRSLRRVLYDTHLRHISIYLQLPHNMMKQSNQTDFYQHRHEEYQPFFHCTIDVIAILPPPSSSPLSLPLNSNGLCQKKIKHPKSLKNFWGAVRNRHSLCIINLIRPGRRNTTYMPGDRASCRAVCCPSSCKRRWSNSCWFPLQRNGAYYGGWCRQLDPSIL